jgi:class 3 adenylate cyclase
MESHAPPGAIQVTADFAERLEQAFVLERRGAVEIKGKGPMETYLLLGERSVTPDAPTPLTA